MQAGEIIGGGLCLETEIGQGATCVIWSAWDARTKERVAVKMLRSEDASDDNLRWRLQKEIAALQRCRHEHIVRVYGGGDEPGFGPYAVMELLEGETLEQKLRRVGTLPPAEVLEIGQAVGKALVRMHALGMVHRDLKPSNVFLAQNAEGGTNVKLLDLGTVKTSPAAAGGGVTEERGLVGTPSHMSPEQLRGYTVDRRSDLWAFAMMVFEALVGSPAIDGNVPVAQVVLAVCVGRLPVPSHHNASIDERFDAWFAKSTQRAAKDRFNHGGEQFEALEEALRVRVGRTGREREVRTIQISLPPTAPFPALVQRAHPDHDWNLNGSSDKSTAKKWVA